MRKSLVLQALLAATIPIVAVTARAGVVSPQPGFILPTPTSLPITPIQMPLTVAPILGATQELATLDGGASDGSVLVPDCSDWPAANCAASIHAPILSPDGTTGTCSEAAYLYCCPTQAVICAERLSALYDNTAKANLADAGATLPVPASMPLGNTSVTGIGYSAAPMLAANVGTGSTVLGNEMMKFTASPYVPKSSASFSQVLSTAQAAYANTWNSPRYSITAPITSCDQYVWDKWAGYAQWEDAARAGANDPVWVAMQTFAALATPPVRSDGPPFSYNETPFTYEYTTGQTIPRNAFLSFVPSWLSATDPTQSAILAELKAEQAAPFVLGAAGSTLSPSTETNDLTLAATCTNQLKRLS